MIFKAVKKVIVNTFDEADESITLGTNLSRDLGLDHQDVCDLVCEVEDIFDIHIPDEEIEQFETVADIVNYVEDH